MTDTAVIATEVAARRSTWTIRTTNGIKVSGHLPKWAGVDPSEDGLAPDLLPLRLDDIQHIRYYPGALVDANMSQGLGPNSGRCKGPTAILCPQIEVDPFDEDPARRIPTAVVELAEGTDDWIEGLDPQGLRDLAATLRQQAQRMEQVAVDLEAARADWAQNGDVQ